MQASTATSETTATQDTTAYEASVTTLEASPSQNAMQPNQV